MKSSSKEKWRARKQRERLEKARARKQQEQDRLEQEALELQNRAWRNASSLNRIRENGIGVPVDGQAYGLTKKVVREEF
jgi:hypothetical protein